MTSPVDILNAALIKVGAKQHVTSFDDGTPGANYAATRYEALRDDLLRLHPWNFAVRRKKLAQLAEEPVFGFRYAYQLPGDWLKLLNVWDNEAEQGHLEFRIEGDRVLTDAPAAYAKYLMKVTDVNQMTADFRECLALKMAIELAIKLANSSSLSQLMEDRYERRLLKARTDDSMDDRPSRLGIGSWITGRFRTGRSF